MDKETKINPKIRKRLEFIEFQLHWAGQVGRKELEEQFEISLQQATKDIGQYDSLFPDSLVYDPRQKTYVQGPAFETRLTAGAVSDYLKHFEALQDGYKDKNEIWPTFVPPMEGIKYQPREIKADSFKLLIKAIQIGQGIRVKYISASSSNHGFRSLYPHAFGSDGHRWHVRAYDLENERYSDFVLSRLTADKWLPKTPFDLPSDGEWERKIELCLIPDPNLNENTRSVLASEYRMRKSVLRIQMRQAMLFYYLRFYGFNPRPVDNTPMRNESSHMLYIDNFDEVQQWLQRRRK